MWTPLEGTVSPLDNSIATDTGRQKDTTREKENKNKHLSREP
jgi:hypothetical protein